MTKDVERYRKIFDSLDPSDDNYIDNFIKAISQVLIERDIFVKNSANNDKRVEFYELLRNQLIRLNARKIEFIGCGHSSLVFRIGDIVVKIGKSETDEKKRRLDLDCLIPLYVDECHKIDEKEYYILQVSPYVDTMSIDKEDVYKAYKRLRDKGYIHNDPTVNNTGRIIKGFSYNGHNYKTGDLVFIDLEDIAYVGLEETSDCIMEEISMLSYNRDVYVFETRYTEEKRKNTK